MSETPATSSLHTTLPLPSKIKQIDGLQILRAVAVLLVALLHVNQQYARPDVTGGLPNMGVFGVDVFFVISGFIISCVVLRMREQPGVAALRAFLLRRLVRIFPIYWLVLVPESLRAMHQHTFALPTLITSAFLFPYPFYPDIRLLLSFGWTLIFEAFFYALVSLLLLFTTRRTVPAYIGLILAAVLAGLALDIRHPLWIVACNPILLEFVAGSGIALLYVRIGVRRIAGQVASAAGWTLAVMLSHLLSVDRDPAANGMQMILAMDHVFLRVGTWGTAATLIVGGMVFWSPSTDRLPARVWVVLGNASYSIYLVSALAMLASSRLLLLGMHGQLPTTRLVMLLLHVLTVAIVIATGWLVYQWVEWPLLRTLQSRLLSR